MAGNAPEADARRVVVTGGAGFIGSHVADAFLAESYKVLVVDDLSTGSLEKIPAGAELAQLDIVDAGALMQAVSAFSPTVVCHLAAQASVTVSVESPERDLSVNVQGTFNVVQAATAAGAPVIFSSTGGALYGEKAPIPSPESTPTEPLSPYGASKLAGEAYVGTWARLHGIPNVILRLGNVYGPRQNSQGEAGVVAIFSDHLHRGSTPTVFGDGLQTRDYIYVIDVAGAFLLAAHGGRADIFNVGRGSESSVLDLLEVLGSLAPDAAEPKFAPPRPGELLRSALDATRLRTTLGWEPLVDLREGLTETYRFYAGAESVDAADPV
jgi:UDP-glucose 4-epimerase